MFVILPIGLERSFDRGPPWATMGLVGVIVAVFLLTWPTMEDRQRAQSEALGEALAYHLAHPGSSLPDDVLRLLPHDARGAVERQAEWVREFDADPEAGRRAVGGQAGFTKGVERLAAAGSAHEMSREMTRGETAKLQIFARLAALDDGERREQQRELLALLGPFDEARKADPAGRYGYVPARGERGVLTYMFLHAGWLHLVFNLIFLGIAAAALEDVWSAPVMLGLFVVTGVTAALVFGATAAGSGVPLVGASGAVAGLMGVALVRLARRRVRFWYGLWAISVVRWRTFSAPVGLMLPLWLIGEVFNAVAFGSDSGVAYAAHVGGFGSGVALGLVLRLTGFERRVLGRDPDEVESDDRDFRPDLLRSDRRAPRRSPLMEEAAVQWRDLHGNVQPLEPPPGDPPPPSISLDEVPDELPGYEVDDDPAPARRPDHVIPFDPRPLLAAIQAPTEAIGPARALALAVERDDAGDALAAYQRARMAGQEAALAPDLVLAVAGYLETAGEPERAARVYRRLAERTPATPETAGAIFHAARLLHQKLEQPQAGRALLAELQRRYPDSEYAARAARLTTGESG